MAEPGETLEIEAARAPREIAFEFRGTGGEYFRIWIVNVFLTLVTLGIYSAWAKVRTLRYFASSTILDGSSFAYLASPISILKGRLLVLGFLLLYSVASFFLPYLEGLLGLAALLLVPWAIVRSMAFRAHNTSWRGVRFAFGATLGDAFVAYIGLPFLSLLTLGLLYPYTVFRQRRFLVDHAAFGTTRFGFAAESEAFYGLFLRLLLLVLVAGIAIAALFATAGDVGAAVAGLALVPLYFYAFGFVAAGIANLTYDGVRLGRHRLVSRLPAAGMALLYATNALAIVVSLGLLVHWTRVRSARFRVEHLGMLAAGDLDDFVAAQGEDVSSLGAEFGEALDLDLGL